MHERTIALRDIFFDRGSTGKPSVLQCERVVRNGAPPRSVMPQPGIDAMPGRRGVAEVGGIDGGDRLLLMGSLYRGIL